MPEIFWDDQPVMNPESLPELSPSCLLGNHDFRIHRVDNGNHCSIYYECVSCIETIIADICWIYIANNEKQWLFQIPKLDSDGKVRPTIEKISEAHNIR